VREAGGQTIRTQVGDRYVVEAMRKNGYNFGGEQSGHLVFLDHVSTGDGIVAALQILSIMIQEGKPLSELADSVMDRVPQSLLSFKVSQKRPLHTLPDVQKLIERVEKELGDAGRVLVRYSGTEAKARVLVEGPNQETIEHYASDIADALTQALS
jgi:phosphoglucosamine mutase